LSLQPAWFFEHFLSKKPDQNSNAITVLILGGFILVLLLTLMNFALVAFGEQFDPDQDDFDLIELGIIKSILVYFFFTALVLGIELSVFPMSLRLEYLRSHIGEKRPASAIVNNSSFRVLFSRTALFVMPSFCLFCAKGSPLNGVG